LETDLPRLGREDPFQGHDGIGRGERAAQRRGEARLLPRLPCVDPPSLRLPQEMEEAIVKERKSALRHARRHVDEGGRPVAAEAKRLSSPAPRASILRRCACRKRWKGRSRRSGSPLSGTPDVT